ncbi:MAG: TatD family deoxyribonuclease [Butyrivibrio sp.]|jgi:TatD DNase family protein|nr:TatD family deoxyribonuclease [Butyrivibrio sp.]
MIFDTHAHYDDEKFDEDRDELLKSLADAGVGTVVDAASTIDSCHQIIELIDKYPFLYGTLGIHPSECKDMTEDDFDWIRQQLKNPKIVAIGEIGLDYYWPEPDHDIQKKWFEKQLELAKETDMPVVIHSRDAAEDTLNMIKMAQLPPKTVDIHCFSYSKEMAREYLNMGYYLGVGGVVTFKNAKKLKEVVEYAPIENILLETDCPYLAPEPNRGKRNSSLNLEYVVDKIAELKNMDREDVISITEKNAQDFYRIKK